MKYQKLTAILVTILFLELTSIAFEQTAYAACGLTFPNGASIDYSSIDADAESSEITLDVRNSGDQQATITVSGTDWVSGSTVHIDGELTKFANSTRASTDYTEKQRLNNTNVELIDFGRIQPTTTNSTYWQVLATMQNLPFSGALTQTITFTVTCV